MKATGIVPLVGATLLASCLMAAGDDKPAVTTRNQRRDILAAIHQALAKAKPTGKIEGPDLDFAARRQVADLHATFQELPVGRGDQVRFARAFLGADGAGFDAIRFRTPPTGERFQLLFELVAPRDGDSSSVRAWNILGLAGDAPPFGPDAARRDDFDLPGVGLPAKNVGTTQTLAGPLAPGTEYLVWFDLKDNDPARVFVKLRLTPVGPPDPPRDLALKKARAAHEAKQAAIEGKYDAERLALRQAYKAELARAAAAPPATPDPGESPRIAAEIDEIRRGEAATAGHRGFRVVRAGYGVDDRWVDVTRQVRGLVRGDSLRFDADQERFKPDPAYGVRKSLMIIYTLDGNLGASITREGESVELPPPAASTDRIPPRP